MANPDLTTVASVEAYFKGVTFDNTATQPKLSEVEVWITRVTSIIYGGIVEKYIIPITDSCDLLQLQELADMYVVSKVRQVIGISSARKLEDGKLNPVTSNMMTFWKILQRYQDCDILLPNSPNNSTILKSSSFNEQNNIEPVAMKEIDQW